MPKIREVSPDRLEEVEEIIQQVFVLFRKYNIQAEEALGMCTIIMGSLLTAIKNEGMPPDEFELLLQELYANIGYVAKKKHRQVKDAKDLGS